MSDAKIIYSSITPEEIIPAGTPRAAFYADSDDHLRVPALLTLQLRERYPTLSEVGAGCLNPNASWSARLDGLQEMLEESSRLRRRSAEPGPLLLLENIEALSAAPAQHLSDDEDEGSAPRAKLRDVLLDSAPRRGIWIQTGAQIPDELAHITPHTSAPQETWIEHLLADVPIVVRELIQRRVELGEEDRVGVELIVESSPEDLTEHLLWETYTTLPARARDAARQIAALRGAQRYNGVLGDLTVETHTLQAEAKVSRRAVEQLVARRWLVRVSDHELLMPWLLRSYALKQAAMWTHDEQQSTWRALVRAADTRCAALTPAQEMELHHRAVVALEIEVAARHSTFYVDDLLARGRSLSAEGRYQHAAELFREITTRHPQNAYAWEYLAFNLEHLDADAHSEAITQGYRLAHELAGRANPLFWARWLAWRIRAGALTEQAAHTEYTSALDKCRAHHGLQRLVQLVEKALRERYETQGRRTPR